MIAAFSPCFCSLPSQSFHPIDNALTRLVCEYIPWDMSKPTRKGAARRSDIPPHVLRALNHGTLETATLSEALAIDFAVLLQTIAPKISQDILKQIQPGVGVTTRMQSIGRILVEQFSKDAIDRFGKHPSDTVRGWVAYAVALLPDTTLTKRLKLIQPLADDEHFGVREWAWLAMRNVVANEIESAIPLLTKWVTHSSPNLRRYASEITRPRGVWCSHIQLLKDKPMLALPILEPLKSDPEKYVQNSVANWLNDAGKSQPEFVNKLCNSWKKQSPTPATLYICKRAMRNL